MFEKQNFQTAVRMKLVIYDNAFELTYYLNFERDKKYQDNAIGKFLSKWQSNSTAPRPSFPERNYYKKEGTILTPRDWVEC